MIKRFIVVGLLVAAFLVLAAPALAFDGYRADYTTTDLCGMCHIGGPEFNEWAESAHGQVGDAAASTANAYPISRGPGCAGCHAGNYDPAKAVPTNPEAPAAQWVYPTANTAGDDAFSEPFVGCSACHRGLPTAHTAPKANMANPDICGQCHARFSNSVEAYPNWDGTSAKREYTLGSFNPLGSATTAPVWTPDPISDFLNVPTPDSPQKAQFWPSGQSASAHGEGAVQYNEWSMEGHARALDALQRFVTPGNPAANRWLNECLDCHSADYRLLKEAGVDVSSMTIEDFEYGVTCQTCHDSHARGTQGSVWNEERNPQLRKPRQQLCVECHNAEIAPQANGRPGSATPGSEVHQPQREITNGTGAIGVQQILPNVHKGRCVQCHMVPTGYEYNGVQGTAGNHLFAIIEPEQAATTTMTFNVLGTPTTKAMPYSSCTTCHQQDGTKDALYLQETLEDVQEDMHFWDDQVTAALGAAAKRLGFSGADDATLRANANAALNAIGRARWTAAQLAFQRAFTNQSMVESEGSWGIHNPRYAMAVITKALDQAESVSPVRTVTLQRPTAQNVRPNAQTRLTGRVRTAATGSVRIQRRVGNGQWRNFKTVNLNAGGFSSSFRMTARGTFRFRAVFAASATQTGGTSQVVRVNVR